MSYRDFIETKHAIRSFDGIEHEPHGSLFPFQRDLVRWALRRGRSAIFADTGLGKSRMEAEWARAVSARGRVLILAPLAVAQQLVREAASIAVEASYLREDDGRTRIVVTNYDMMSHFDVSGFSGLVLDESSILKAYSGAFRNAIIEASQSVPYRLAATATPAPNDYTELGNHSEFLGVQTRAEMLAEYFCHDGGDTATWRLKGHAVDPFWRWVTGWAAIVKMPSDLGYDDGKYRLPPLRWHEHVVGVDHSEYHAAGLLFAPSTMTLTQQRAVRRSTLDKRIEMAAQLAGGDGPVLVWGELNSETEAAAELIAGAVEVAGSDSPDDKADRLLGFADGEIRCLVTKPKIAGHGMNWQHCRRIVFLGASHSYEQTYQAIRRCWRFGQTQPVDVHVIRAENEGSVVANYKRKEQDAQAMWDSTRPMIRDAVRSIGSATGRIWNDYNPIVTMEIPSWLRSQS
jgi:superfamily II DNA or RNA helicase